MFTIACGIVLGVIMLIALVYATGWLGFGTWLAFRMVKPREISTPRKPSVAIDMYGVPLNK